MSLPFLITGFVLGFAGSLHCVGMCGPLALALPLQAFEGGKRIAAVILYNLGRVTSYVLLGIITAAIGKQFFLAGYQQLFSFIVGALLVGWLLLTLAGKTNNKTTAIYYRIQEWIVRYMQQPSLKNMLFTGFGNGLLPCGMVYMAIAAAAASGDTGTGAVFMIFFGLGTVPLMAMVSFAGLRIRPATRNTLRKVSPYITALIGVLLILRGLNLDIPYISPLLTPHNATAIPCN